MKAGGSLTGETVSDKITLTRLRPKTRDRFEDTAFSSLGFVHVLGE